MPLTVRSKELNVLIPAVRSAIAQVRLPPAVAEDAVQRALIALTPHIELLGSMAERERAVYVWKTATRVAFRVRREQGPFVELAEESEDSGVPPQTPEATAAPLVRVDPETEVGWREKGDRLQLAFAELPTQDRHVVGLVADQGLSERDAAKEIGKSRGSVAFRLRRAREILWRAWTHTTSWRQPKSG